VRLLPATGETLLFLYWSPQSIQPSIPPSGVGKSSTGLSVGGVCCLSGKTA